MVFQSFFCVCSNWTNFFECFFIFFPFFCLLLLLRFNWSFTMFTLLFGRFLVSFERSCIYNAKMRSGWKTTTKSTTMTTMSKGKKKQLIQMKLGIWREHDTLTPVHTPFTINNHNWINCISLQFYWNLFIFYAHFVQYIYLCIFIHLRFLFFSSHFTCVQ